MTRYPHYDADCPDCRKPCPVPGCAGSKCGQRPHDRNVPHPDPLLDYRTVDSR